jgi:hypothetical protein
VTLRVIQGGGEERKSPLEQLEHDLADGNLAAVEDADTSVLIYALVDLREEYRDDDNDQEKLEAALDAIAAEIDRRLPKRKRRKS